MNGLTFLRRTFLHMEIIPNKTPHIISQSTNLCLVNSVYIYECDLAMLAFASFASSI